MYDINYAKEVMLDFTKTVGPDYESLNYTFELSKEGTPCEFKLPPVKLGCKFFGGNLDNSDIADEILHHCLLGLRVEVRLGGDIAGSFVSNNLTDPWEAIPLFEKHPQVYQLLLNSVIAFIVSKYGPRRVKKANTEAAGTRS